MWLIQNQKTAGVSGDSNSYLHHTDTEKHHRQLSNWPLEVTGHRTAASVTGVRQVTVYTLQTATTEPSHTRIHAVLSHLVISQSIMIRPLKRAKVSKSRNVKVTVWISTTLLALVSCHPMLRGGDGDGLDLDTSHQTFHQIENTWYLCHPVSAVSIGWLLKLGRKLNESLTWNCWFWGNGELFIWLVMN